MLMTPQAEKTLVYLPQAQGYEDVDPEEMGGGGGGKRDSLLYILLSSLENTDTFFIPIGIQRSRVENSATVANMVINSIFHETEFMIN